jgi:Uma2 family endonuclease
MSLVAERTYTPQDLLELPDAQGFELVDGQLVEREMSTLSVYVATRLARKLSEFVEGRGLGWVFGEGASFQCFPHDAEMVRRADVSFIQSDRLSIEQALERGHLRVAPDLAVEVVSPHDQAYEVDAKVADYLEAGVKLVWVINPDRRIVQVHRAQGQGVILRERDELSGDDVLPGFHCPVADLFQLPPQAEQATHLQTTRS